MLGTKNGIENVKDLLQLIGEVLDTVATGGECYMIIGGTKDKSSLTVTVVNGNERATVYAESLIDLSARCQELL